MRRRTQTDRWIPVVTLALAAALLFGCRERVEQIVNPPSPTPARTHTPRPGEVPTPIPTPTPRPTVGPSPSPTPTQPSGPCLDGSWTGTVVDANAFGCPQLSEGISMEIRQSGSNVTATFRSDHDGFDPSKPTRVSGTYDEASHVFGVHAEVPHGTDITTHINFDVLVTDCTEMVGTYQTQDCNDRLGTCFCTRNGSLRVTKR